MPFTEKNEKKANAAHTIRFFLKLWFALNIYTPIRHSLMVARSSLCNSTRQASEQRRGSELSDPMTFKDYNSPTTPYEINKDTERAKCFTKLRIFI